MNIWCVFNGSDGCVFKGSDGRVFNGSDGCVFKGSDGCGISTGIMAGCRWWCIVHSTCRTWQTDATGTPPAQHRSPTPPARQTGPIASCKWACALFDCLVATNHVPQLVFQQLRICACRDAVDRIVAAHHAGCTRRCCTCFKRRCIRVVPVPSASVVHTHAKKGMKTNIQSAHTVR